MRLQQRIKELEKSHRGASVDLVAALYAGRYRAASGLPPPPREPTPPEWENSRNRLERRLFHARRRACLL